MASPFGPARPATSSEKPIQAHPGRPTIGRFAYEGGALCARMVWNGAASVTHERNANLICSPGKPLPSPHEFEAMDFPARLTEIVTAA